MAITRFQDLPSTNTPINSANLNGNFDELGVKVGTSVDSNYRVNLIKGKNLFSLNNYTYNTSISSDGKIISNHYTNMYFIPIQYGKSYVMSFTDNSSSGNVLYGFSNEIPTIDTSCTYNVTTCPQLNNMVFTPVNASNKYLCIRLRYDLNQIPNMSNIQIEEGTTATSYEAYITPSINVDGEEIYRKDNLEQYSTNEIRIGTWIDGKPLYRKTILYINNSQIGSLNNKTDLNIPHNISNMAYCIKASGYRLADTNSVYPLPQLGGTSSAELGTIIREVSSSNIVLRILNDTWGPSYWYFTLEYTKTTDTATRSLNTIEQTRSIPTESTQDDER